VGEILAVDSNSNDGTKELLEERLKPHGGQIISTDPGLYKAWNLAARRATQPYIYYSTICDIISKDGLSNLYDIASENELDVVISVPRILSAQGLPVKDVKWPIHYVVKYLNFANDLALYEKEAYVRLVQIFLPASILGSSASNLYRTEVIQQNPFPEDYGVVGDSVWAVRNLPLLKVGITHKEFASFCWDGIRNGTWDEGGVLMERMLGEAEKWLTSEQMTHAEQITHINYIVTQSSTDHLRDECIRLQAVIDEYDDYVKFLTRPLSVKMKDGFFKYTSIRYWWGKIRSSG